MKLLALPAAALVALFVAGCGSSAAETGAVDDSATTQSSSSASPSASPGGALVSADTALEAVCGPLERGFIKEPTVDVETFGQAWEKITDEQSCELEGAADYDFAWDGYDEEGYNVPFPEYRTAAQKPWEGIDDDERDDSRVSLTLSKCHEYEPNLAAKKSSPDSIRYFAASLEMCPEHPQADQWQELADRLPQAEKEAKASEEKWIAEQEAKAEATKAAEEAEKKKLADAAEANKNFIDDGSHDLVGVTLNPGLYRSIGPVKNCYWELADSAGNIIDNNFISTGVQFEVTIPDAGGTFTLEGCAMKRVEG